MVSVASPVSRADAGYRRLLVPITGAAESERAMESACALAAEHGVTIAAPFVIEVSPLLPLDAQMADEEETGREALERARAIADAFGLKVQGRTIRARDAGRAIVELAEEEQIEAIVIAAPRTRRLRGRRMAFDGTVRHVLAKAPCRVLVVAGPAF
jgi:nucleotide-binding universal stress UspA family protein